MGGNDAPAFTVQQTIKDFDLILDTARTDHVPMKMVALVHQQDEQAFADGDGQRDFFVLRESEPDRGRRGAVQ